MAKGVLARKFLCLLVIGRLDDLRPVARESFLVELDTQSGRVVEVQDTLFDARFPVVRSRTRTDRGRGWRKIPGCSRWAPKPAGGRAALAHGAVPCGYGTWRPYRRF